MQFNVEKGKIVEGQVFSDCLVPVFIDALNEELATGEITYDVSGVKELRQRVQARFETMDGMDAVNQTYLPELEKWLVESI